MNTKKLFPLALRLIAAIILLQTLFFKFSAHPQSVELFTKLGVEPWGRIGTGVIELITGVLLLIPATAFVGGILSIGLMLGAIGSHLAVIGIASHGDGGLLFIMAIIVLLCALAVAYIYRQQGLDLMKKFGRSSFL
jgi:putative oxidoreductase